MDTAQRLRNAMHIMRFGKWKTAKNIVKAKWAPRNAGNVRRAMLMTCTNALAKPWA